MTLQADFDQTLDDLLGQPLPDAVAVAVSGGGDSMALMVLAAGWGRVRGVQVRTVTVDHGLRAESGAEAAQVAAQAANLGLDHTILHWDAWDGQGNLQAAARRARYALIDGWRGDIRHLLTGHTLDDQAETFLMRLARGSGVEGLAAMAPVRTGRMVLVRPLLTVRRAALRAILREADVSWVEDPSNEDDRFDRVRARVALKAAEPLGLSAKSLAETAARMARAGRALRARAVDVAERYVSEDRGDFVIERVGFAAVERDTQMRLLAAMLGRISSADYRPRAVALEAALDSVLAGGHSALQGCLIRSHRTGIRVSREYYAVADMTLAFGAGPWDRRWVLDGEGFEECEVRALGEEGLAQVGTLPDTALPRTSLEATPAIWKGDRLVASSFADFGPKHGAELHYYPTTFTEFLLSH